MTFVGLCRNEKLLRSNELKNYENLVPLCQDRNFLFEKSRPLFIAWIIVKNAVKAAIHTVFLGIGAEKDFDRGL